MFDKYYKSEYLKIKEYEKISNVSFEKFVLNIIKIESEKYPKRRKSTTWIMMLLSFFFGLFIIIESWNLFLWLGLGILSVKALLILGIPSIFVSGILLRWIFSSDLTHIDLAKMFIVDNISLSELYLAYITSTETIAEYSKNCTDDIVKLLYDKTNITSTEENPEKDNSLEDNLIEENSIEKNNLDLEETKEPKDDNILIEDENTSNNMSEENSIEEATAQAVNTEEDTSTEDISTEDTSEENASNIDNDNEESNNEANLDVEDISNKNSEEIVDVTEDILEEVNETVSEINDNLQIDSEEKYDMFEIHKRLKNALILNSLNNIESAKILLKDIIAIDTFEKSSHEDSLNKALKKSIYKEFEVFINDESIIW